MPDEFREVTTSSWGSRIKNAFMGILFGLGLIIAAIVLIFWNENHSIHMTESLRQVQKILVPVPNSPINNQNNQKVVYFTGLASAKDNLSDSLLGVTVNAITLERAVEMYQWQESTHKEKHSQLGGGEEEVTTYSYNKVWSSHLINSSNFKKQEGHQNPTVMPIESKTQYADKVTVGDFSIPRPLIQQINVIKPIELTDANKEPLKAKLNKPIELINNLMYVGEDPRNPQLGDLRVSLSAVYAQDVSVIGQQAGTTVQSYLAPAGESIILLSTGTVSSKQMISDALSENKMITWVLRAVSLLMLVIGFRLFFRPIVVFADFLPFLGSLLGYSLGFIGFVLGLGVWSIVTAIAWFATRPIFSVGIIAVVVILIFLSFKMKKNKVRAN